ncbi:MAG: ATP-binding protein [Spirochaetes bacterium]|nr:ATP-binding protein [Spirochaetota bacterium]
MFNNDLTNLTMLVKNIESFIQQHSENAKLVYKVQLVVDEIVTNIIKYGYKKEEENTIIVNIRSFQNLFTITIKDNAKYFNPMEHTLPDLNKHKELKKTGGLGIFMTRQYVDKLDHDYQNGNILKIKIYK